MDYDEIDLLSKIEHHLSNLDFSLMDRLVKPIPPC